MAAQDSCAAWLVAGGSARVALLFVLLVLVEPARPPEHGDVGADGDESTVRDAPLLVPVTNDTERVDQREPSQQSDPRVFVGHLKLLKVWFYN
jgi:hypothetical protein